MLGIERIQTSDFLIESGTSQGFAEPTKKCGASLNQSSPVGELVALAARRFASTHRGLSQAAFP
jgi:hypothetical protein